MSIVRLLHCYGPVWLPCVRSCCVPDKRCGLWSGCRSLRRFNDGFAFLRFLEFCAVVGNKSNCNLVNFCCKLQLQLHKKKKSPLQLQLLKNMQLITLN